MPHWRVPDRHRQPRRQGYTLIALGYNGKASSVQVKGKFKLVPPAKKFTLHLRAANGKYAGAVVVGGKGRRVIVGLKGGAKLGKLKLSRGFARPAKALPASMLDKSRTAKARKGVPIGAGVYGLVKSARNKAAVWRPWRGTPTTTACPTRSTWTTTATW